MVHWRLMVMVVTAATILTASWVAAAPPPAAQTEALKALDLPIQKARLDNGLRIVMNVNRNAPNVAICITYDVGSRNEELGRSGFAHLFEHMMFQGSRHVEKGEHFKLVTSRGGTLNGTTSKDRTNYFETLPSNELALALWLEADRMKWLAVTPENMENQRAVVQEEYRMRVSNRAYAVGSMKLSELVYQGYFPYAHDPIGSMEDLDVAKFEWVKAFFDLHYAPNNAVLSITGDFEPDEAMKLVREYFGDATAQPKVPPFAPPPMPEQTAERTAEMTDANAKTPGVYYGWAIPPFREDDHYALEIAAVLLGDGESSRLHQRLVRQQAKARSAGVWTSDQRGPDQFTVHVQLTEGATFEQIERGVGEEISQLANAGPTTAELDKAKNRVLSSFVFGIESNLDRATKLSSFELYYGDARLLSREPARYLAVTREQVQAAVRRYLVKNRRSTVKIRPVAPAPKADKEKR